MVFRGKEQPRWTVRQTPGDGEPLETALVFGCIRGTPGGVPSSFPLFCLHGSWGSWWFSPRELNGRHRLSDGVYVVPFLSICTLGFCNFKELLTHIH